ncbi:hypothetical protein [Brevundimonas lutea]|uniref:hypothetical protein n=1 Tax=Brevundimonas lutea TaxID=2293980 RepID=UPI000F02E0AD|nr:hypothetical protein [Brevundimonas lutea]
MLMSVFAVLALSQDPTTAGVSSPDIRWAEPTPEVAAPPAEPPPPIPDSARADPFGYERAQCSPYVRDEGESLEACQMRVRQALAANLGSDLPEGLALERRAPDCTPGLEGQRPLECDRPRRQSGIVRPTLAQTCRTVPQSDGNDRVTWREECRTDGAEEEGEGLKLRLFGGD